jgi:hypothetical protein
VLSLLTPPPAYAVHAVRTREHTYTHTHTHTHRHHLYHHHTHNYNQSRHAHHSFATNNLLSYASFCVTFVSAPATLTNPFMHKHHPSLPWLQSVRLRTLLCTNTTRHYHGCSQYASDAPTRNGPPAPNFRVGDNTVYTSSGNVTVGQYRNISLVDWVARGHDRGTTAHVLPTDSDLVRMIRAVLAR